MVWWGCRLAMLLLFSLPVTVTGEEGTAPEAAPPCATCAGLRIAPTQPFAAFVMVADGKPYETPAPWQPCPKCRAGVGEGGAVEDLRASLSKALEEKVRWEERSGAELTLVATPYLALYTPARPQEIRSYALMAEKLAGHLQTLTGSMALTRTRCDRDVILLLTQLRNCEQFVDTMAKAHPEEGWERLKNTSGGVDRHIGFSDLTRSGPTADHHVVYLFGQMLMYEATDDKAPPWLREGFAAYGERVVFHQNLYASYAYKENQPRIEPHWPRAVRAALQKGESISVGGVLSMDLSSASATDYLGCFSVVSYLLDVHPKEFMKFVLLLRAGESSRKALEAAYDKSIDDLNAEWRRWAMNLGAR